MRRFMNRIMGEDEDEDRVEDIVLVQHGRETHNITFLKGSITDGTITVLDLRKAVQGFTKTPELSHVKLVCKGQPLKDDSTPLVSYGIKSGAKVLAMASKTKIVAPGGSSSGTLTPPVAKKKIVLKPMEQIELVQKYIDGTMIPLVEAFEKTPPKEKDVRETEHRRLGETIMGELLKLDSVDTDGIDGAEVRKRRKESVKGMQGILERLDIALRKADSAPL